MTVAVEPKTVRERVAELIRDDRSLCNPREVADRILASLTPDDYETVLREVLPQYVRLSLTEMRRFKGDSVAHLTHGNHGSPRWRAASTTLSSIFDQRQGFGDGLWKRFGDVTASDCLVLVREYRGRAAANAIKAKQFQALHDLMAKRSAARVEDLSEDEVVAIFRSDSEEET